MADIVTLTNTDEDIVYPTTKTSAIFTTDNERLDNVLVKKGGEFTTTGGLIDTLQDESGNTLYPKTRTDAVYDASGNRLDNILKQIKSVQYSGAIDSGRNLNVTSLFDNPSNVCILGIRSSTPVYNIASPVYSSNAVYVHCCNYDYTALASGTTISGTIYYIEM